ncbi:MAG: DUF1211 domain-containing protein [Spartobacteria bacterium]|nr:DUF1211 domain-containing protein [Spartobacteria bacterium]
MLMQWFDSDFRWRGDDFTRIEGLSDAVFGFAITLLVVSLEVPRTFDELLANMRGFVSFGLSFMLLLNIWFKHFIYFRRFRFADKTVVFLNSALLFMVLFYIYPLKFLFSLINAQWLAGSALQETIRPDQYPALIQYFSAGYAIISLIFLFMNAHAYRLHELFELNEKEKLIIRFVMIEQATSTIIGICSMPTVSGKQVRYMI